jgi:hypothetical protein
VLVPPIVFDVDDIAMHRFDRRSSIPDRMASMLVEIALVSVELVLQISRTLDAPDAKSCPARP